MHVAGGAPGYNGKNYHLVDVSDPTKPERLSYFALEGQKQGAPKTGAKLSLHGPAHIEADRAYLSYGDGGGIISTSRISRIADDRPARISGHHRDSGDSFLSAVAAPQDCLDQ